MFIFGVVDVGHDPAGHGGGPVDDDVVELASDLLADGAGGIELRNRPDVGLTSPEDEWASVRGIVSAIATLGVPVSLRTARAEMAQLALEDGASALTVTDGVPTDELLRVASAFDVPVVVQLVPRELASDPTASEDELAAHLAANLDRADRFGLRDRCVIDPVWDLAATGRPSDAGDGADEPIVRRIRAIRRFDRPISIELPAAVDDRQDGLLRTVFDHGVEFGRTTDPSAIRRFQQRRLG